VSLPNRLNRKETILNYSGIDLHSNNSVVSVIDETDRVVAEKRLPNDLAKILAYLAPWLPLARHCLAARMTTRLLAFPLPLHR
jgi:hypothetical protein